MPEVVKFILLLIGGYLMGAIPTAYLVAQWRRRVDIRQYGSGNVGGANLVKIGARGMAVGVVIFDIAKAMPAVWVAQIVGLDITQQVIIGIAAVVGHNWPVFLRFSGGRGIATIMGAALIVPLVNDLMIPWSFIAFLAIMIINLFTVRNIPIGIGIAVAAMPIVSAAVGEPLALTLGFVAMFVIMVIRRLTPRRAPISASVPTGELLLNRLLFDRDIRDRETWIHQDRNSTEKETKD
ncbi:MAG: glycerol-3-phosphate acyltransferase [Dehalococcoidia bacterium]|jgi:glycerol-3-phosphate acyltransferase PlsY